VPWARAALVVARECACDLAACLESEGGGGWRCTLSRHPKQQVA